MIKNDYILDMVESLGKSFGKLISEVKEDPEPIAIENLSDKDILIIMLKKMITNGKYNEAENLLFKFAENNKINDIDEIGKWFYYELSLKSDDDLLERNFSRYEIAQGLKDFNIILNKE